MAIAIVDHAVEGGRDELEAHRVRPEAELDFVRPVSRRAGVAVVLVSALGLVGCSVPSMEVSEAVGLPLSNVTIEIPETSTLLIQDVSPRVGLESTYRSWDDDNWIVVASCADSANLGDASIVEVAVIPKAAYTSTVREDLAGDRFESAVSCDGRSYR